MQRIYLGDQVKDLDNNFLKKSGLLSYDLMEIAAEKFVTWFLAEKNYQSDSILVLVGLGNNGGDGYAIARLLALNGYQITLVEMFDSTFGLTADAKRNKELIPSAISIFNWNQFEFGSFKIVIDCFLGVGLKGILRNDAIAKIEWINQFQGKIISVDLPSGLPAELGEFVLAVKASVTVTFQFPKLSLFAPEYAEYTGVLVVLPIGLEDFVDDNLPTDKFYLLRKDIKPLHRVFNRFSFKGDFGKVLLVGGSKGKFGATQLACKSALRTGAGLVSCLIDDFAFPIFQTSIPEVMCGTISDLEIAGFDAIGIGPGWGTSNRKGLFLKILKDSKKPMVLDADALNLLAIHPDLIGMLPENSILTPHIGEFSRLVGPSKNYFERIESAKNFAVKHKLILVLKGPNSLIALPDGRQIFNSSGTPNMATGGSGDVFTGLITSFLGMGYSPENAAMCGVYHHGLAGELAGKVKRRGLIASDIVEAIPETYQLLSIL